MEDQRELVHDAKVEEPLRNDHPLQNHHHDGNEDEEPTSTPGETCSVLPLPTRVKGIQVIKMTVVQIIECHGRSNDAYECHHLDGSGEGKMDGVLSGGEDGGGYYHFQAIY